MMDQRVASVLYKKECPNGHRCMALDCIECMESYEKADGPEVVDITKTFPVRNIEESIQ